MNKQNELDKIAREIEKCKECKVNKGGKAVPGEGDPNARIVFLGEAPGRQEAISGRPFIGRSGKLLRKLIGELGLSEEGIFITSPVKYLPNYRTPKSRDIIHGKLHLEKQLGVINPKLIVLLGRVAKEAMLGKKRDGLVGKKILKENSRTYFLTVHPAAALRFPKFKKALIDDFKAIRKLLITERLV